MWGGCYLPAPHLLSLLPICYRREFLAAIVAGIRIPGGPVILVLSWGGGDREGGENDFSDDRRVGSTKIRRSTEKRPHATSASTASGIGTKDQLAQMSK